MVSAEETTNVGPGTAAIGSNGIKHVSGGAAGFTHNASAVGTLRGKNVGPVSAGGHMDINAVAAAVGANSAGHVPKGSAGLP